MSEEQNEPAGVPEAPKPPASAEPSAEPGGEPGAKRQAPPGKRPPDRFKRPRAKTPMLSLDDIEMPRSKLKLSELDADIESELQEALSGVSQDNLFAAESRPEAKAASGDDKGPKKGKVLAVHGADVFIDVPGGRSQGVLSLLQFPDGPPAPGTEVSFDIEGYDRANGLLILARRGAAVIVDWSSVAIGQTVEARVTETNKGGLAVEVNGIRGFMPISQIDLYRVDNADSFVNQKLLCMVVEVDPQERNLVVSRRALLEKEREEQREKIWADLAEGQVRDGIVRSVRDFGAFVDLGGVDGLIHVSEMSWSRVKDPASVVQPGQAVKVVVLKVDRDARKVGLGLKQLQPSPWDNIGAKYPPGLMVKARITRIAEFGAFAELEPGVEGLIHVSELAPQRVRRISDVVQVEQEVQVMVLDVDPQQRRISLSLKAAQAEAEAEEEASEPEVEKPPRPRDPTLRGGIR
ncbi:MAG: S1 RNA-binding domain-containing protein [Planctomycetes bacterium]|nr:S1 RNA-binding domain-containing protein [Planctomycetota bacterium]